MMKRREFLLSILVTLFSFLIFKKMPSEKRIPVKMGVWYKEFNSSWQWIEEETEIINNQIILPKSFHFLINKDFKGQKFNPYLWFKKSDSIIFKELSRKNERSKNRR